ncbi:MAG: hypothetical protein ACM3SQ_20915 [Betaproteobacteria bacterium]
MRTRFLTGTLGAVAAMALAVGVVSAQPQKTNPRFGRWKLKQPPPALNIMTYEPYGDGGMRITVDSTSKDGRKSSWTYVTMFDGKDEPVTGNPGSDTAAVRVINEHVNEIVYKKNGKVTQVLNNVLSDDGDRLEIDYKRTGPDGKPIVTHATYERIK